MDKRFTFRHPLRLLDNDGRNLVNDPTVLYGIAPFGIGTGDIESLQSYLERLADAHCLPFTVLIREVIASHPKVARQLDAAVVMDWCGRTRSCEQRESRWAPQAVGVHIARNIQSLTGVDVSQGTGAKLCQAFSRYGLFTRQELYCPLCLGEGHEPRYVPLLWRIQGVEACVIHNVKLLNAGDCSGRRIQYFQRKRLPWVCGECGSDGFACEKRIPVAASEEAIWRANQVRELIRHLATEEVDEQCLFAGIETAARLIGGGRAYAAARIAGISKSLLHGWITGRYKPGIDSLLRMCETARVPLVSVVVGRPSLERGVVTRDEPQRNRRTRNVDRNQRIALMEKAISEVPPISLAGLAMRIGVNPKTLRKDAPKLAHELVERAASWRRTMAAQKKQVEFAALTDAATQIRLSGQTVTLRALRRATMLSVRPASRGRAILGRLRRTCS